MALNLTVQNWLPDARRYIGVDFIAGLTLWALVVPQSIAYAKLAGAPSPISGLYCIIIVMPIYAIFASSRLLVPSPTTAVSATFSGFLAAMMSEPESAMAALVIGTSIAYFVFSFLKLGFLTDFISKPVSMGYLSGLTIIVVVGQFPKLLGYDVPSGNLVEQILGIFAGLGQTNWVTFLFSVLALLIFFFLPKVSNRIPAGLVVLVLAVILSWVFKFSESYGVSMVGELPGGLPHFSLPKISLAELSIVIPASVGLVVLASGEASVTAETLAQKNGQRLDMNQQFFAFGMGNLVGGFFGSVLGTGASSASMVNSDADAKTPMSLIWASIAALLTVLFLTGLFEYVPNAFLASLVIAAVWKMLAFKQILHLFKLSKSEYFLALLAQVSVLVFGILNGLLLSMLINVLYYAYATSRIETSQYGLNQKDGDMLVPLSFDDAVKLPKNVLALGTTEGYVFYASARLGLKQASDLVASHPDAKYIILSLERMNAMDYTTYMLFCYFISQMMDQDKTVYLTNVHSQHLRDQFAQMNFDKDRVIICEHLDLTAFQP